MISKGGDEVLEERRLEKTKPKKTRPEKTTPDKTRHDHPKEGKTRQHQTTQGKTIQKKARQDIHYNSMVGKHSPLPRLPHFFFYSSPQHSFLRLQHLFRFLFVIRLILTILSIFSMSSVLLVFASF